MITSILIAALVAVLSFGAIPASVVGGGPGSPQQASVVGGGPGSVQPAGSAGASADSVVGGGPG